MQIPSFPKTKSKLLIWPMAVKLELTSLAEPQLRLILERVILPIELNWGLVEPLIIILLEIRPAFTALMSSTRSIFPATVKKKLINFNKNIFNY